ncbi:SWI/SNF chromatin-remodeling complex subunit, partial [Ascosphaera atra]
ALQALNSNYPRDSFEAVMRYSAVDSEAGIPIPNPAAANKSNIKYYYIPRIRCHDCPGKLYTPGPMQTVDNFEVHLKNRQHKERVEARLAREGGVKIEG